MTSRSTIRSSWWRSFRVAGFTRASGGGMTPSWPRSFAGLPTGQTLETAYTGVNPGGIRKLKGTLPPVPPGGLIRARIFVDDEIDRDASLISPLVPSLRTRSRTKQREMLREFLYGDNCETPRLGLLQLDGGRYRHNGRRIPSTLIARRILFALSLSLPFSN